MSSMAHKKPDFKKFAADMKLLVAHPYHVFQPIKDIAKAIYNSFFDYGIEVEIQAVNKLENLNALAMQGTYSHILSINTHDYLEAEKAFYLDKPKITRMMTYNLEQTPIEEQNSFWAAMRLNEVGYYGIYFDYIVTESQCKEPDLHNMGFRTLHLNLPYHPCLDLGTQPTLEDKEYDVFFVGCGSDRRQSLIDGLIKEGVTVAPARIPQSLDPVFKAEMVKKSKICLNVHFSDMEYFEKPRIMYDYLMNRGVVVSEKILYPEAFEHIKDMFMCRYVNLVPMIMVIKDKFNEETLQIGYNAYEKFKTEYHYEKVIDSFLQQLYVNEWGKRNE